MWHKTDRLIDLYSELEYYRNKLRNSQYKDQYNFYCCVIDTILVQIDEITGKSEQNSPFNDEYQQKRESF